MRRSVCSYYGNTCGFLCFLRQTFSLQVLYELPKNYICTRHTYTCTVNTRCLDRSCTALGSVCFLTYSHCTLHSKTPSIKSKVRAKPFLPEMPTTREQKNDPSKGNYPSSLLQLFHSPHCCTMPAGLLPELCNAHSAHVHTETTQIFTQGGGLRFLSIPAR